MRIRRVSECLTASSPARASHFPACRADCVDLNTMMSRLWRINAARILRGVVIFCALAVSGCSLESLKTQDRLDKGLVLVLPGIEGRSVWNWNIVKGLDDGGVDCAIEIYDWCTVVPGGMFINLTDIERNRHEAEKLRSFILKYREEHPGRPLQLVGHSGGAALAVMATETLPDDVKVTSLTLLGAALSPAYDLRGALQHSDKGIRNYFSYLDDFFLGPGTQVFGTMDREHSLGAGKIGFRAPRSLSPEDQLLYNKLHQISWRPSMQQYDNDGGHFGTTQRRFVERYLAPAIAEWTTASGSDTRAATRTPTSRSTK